MPDSAAQRSTVFTESFRPAPAFLRFVYTRSAIVPAACFRGMPHGHYLYRPACRLCAGEHSARVLLREIEETAMNWIYILSGIVSLAIVIYLVIALLYPEKFQ